MKVGKVEKRSVVSRSVAPFTIALLSMLIALSFSARLVAEDYVKLDPEDVNTTLISGGKKFTARRIFGTYVERKSYNFSGDEVGVEFWGPDVFRDDAGKVYVIATEKQDYQHYYVQIREVNMAVMDELEQAWYAWHKKSVGEDYQQRLPHQEQWLLDKEFWHNWTAKDPAFHLIYKLNCPEPECAQKTSYGDYFYLKGFVNVIDYPPFAKEVKRSGPDFVDFIDDIRPQ